MRAVLAGVLLAGVLVPAAAWAGFPGSINNDYEAEVERDMTTSLGFDRSKENEIVFVDEFDLANIPFSCSEGFGTSERINVVFEGESLPVAGGRFAGKVRANTTLPYVLDVEGEFRSGGRAKGLMSLRARDGDVRCYSGVLRWRDDGQ